VDDLGVVSGDTDLDLSLFLNSPKKPSLLTNFASTINESYDSTSENSKSSHDSHKNDKIAALSIDTLCAPLMAILENKRNMDIQKFAFDVCGGLVGSDVVHQYACAYDPSSKNFFIWLGNSSIGSFSKSSFMNLTNFAEL